MLVIFDSGIGGFSILRHILREKNGPSITYLADQQHFPYGSKSSEWLKSRLREIAIWARDLSPEAFVIACNTGTVAGIAEMRQVLHCPVIGVEPVIKPLATFERALVLATPATAASERTKELVSTYGQHIQVYASESLAGAIENNDDEQVKILLEQLSEKIKRENIQAIGLSCTHYPLILERLERELPDVHFYDPSRAVVTQIKKATEIQEDRMAERTVHYYTTGGVVRFNEQIHQYIGQEYNGEHIDI